MHQAVGIGEGNVAGIEPSGFPVRQADLIPAVFRVGKIAARHVHRRAGRDVLQPGGRIAAVPVQGRIHRDRRADAAPGRDCRRHHGVFHNPPEVHLLRAVEIAGAHVIGKAQQAVRLVLAHAEAVVRNHPVQLRSIGRAVDAVDQQGPRLGLAEIVVEYRVGAVGAPVADGRNPARGQLVVIDGGAVSFPPGNQVQHFVAGPALLGGGRGTARLRGHQNVGGKPGPAERAAFGRKGGERVEPRRGKNGGPLPDLRRHAVGRLRGAAGRGDRSALPVREADGKAHAVPPRVRDRDEGDGPARRRHVGRRISRAHGLRRRDGHAARGAAPGGGSGDLRRAGSLCGHKSVCDRRDGGVAARPGEAAARRRLQVERLSRRKACGGRGKGHGSARGRDGLAPVHQRHILGAHIARLPAGSFHLHPSGLRGVQHLQHGAVRQIAENPARSARLLPQAQQIGRHLCPRDRRAARPGRRVLPRGGRSARKLQVLPAAPALAAALRPDLNPAGIGIVQHGGGSAPGEGQDDRIVHPRALPQVQVVRRRGRQAGRGGACRLLRRRRRFQVLCGAPALPPAGGLHPCPLGVGIIQHRQGSAPRQHGIDRAAQRRPLPQVQVRGGERRARAGGRGNRRLAGKAQVLLEAVPLFSARGAHLRPLRVGIVEHRHGDVPAQRQDHLRAGAGAGAQIQVIRRARGGGRKGEDARQRAPCSQHARAENRRPDSGRPFQISTHSNPPPHSSPDISLFYFIIIYILPSINLKSFHFSRRSGPPRGAGTVTMP